MAIYVWRCKTCGKDEEVIRKPSDWDSQPDEPCCANPDRHRLPPTGVGTAYGINWTATSYRDGKGGKGNWGKS
jgi:predicted nucleic acid-binding Zn ribbon protein